MTIIDVLLAFDGIIGVVVGFILSLGVSLWQRRQEDKQRAESVKTMLRLEIDHNLALLHQTYARIEKEKTTPDLHPLTIPGFVARMEWPYWSSLALESQIPYVPSALESDTIHQVYVFYSNLWAISGIREAIEHNQNQEGYRRELANRCTETMQQMIGAGNPIKRKSKWWEKRWGK